MVLAAIRASGLDDSQIDQLLAALAAAKCVGRAHVRREMASVTYSTCPMRPEGPRPRPSTGCRHRSAAVRQRIVFPCVACLSPPLPRCRRASY